MFVYVPICALRRFFVLIKQVVPVSWTTITRLCYNLFIFFIFCHHNVRAKETSWCLPFNTFPWPELHPISLDLSPTVWGPGVLLIGSLYVPESVGM